MTVSASSCKGLGNPTWKGQGWASLCHPTERAAWLGLGAAARCGAGGFTGPPRAPCTSYSRSSVSLLQAFYLLGSNFAPGVDQEEGHTVPAAGLAEVWGYF